MDSRLLIIVYILTTAVADGSWIVVRTPDDFNERIYDEDHAWWTTGERTVFRFQVKACTVASLQLEKRAGDKTSSLYNIAIGDIRVHGFSKRQRTGIAMYKYPRKIFRQPWIRKYTKEGAPKLLNCSEFRSFWISWTNNYITVGSGDSETSGTILLQKKDDKPIGQVNAISFRTLFATGEWRIERSESMEPCPNNWVTGPDGSQCYLFVESKKQWSRAVEDCICRGGNLACIRNQQETDFLKNEANTISRSDAWWLGLKRGNTTLQCSDATQLNNETISSRKWWPDNERKRKHVKCVQLRENDMSINPCRAKLWHICQKPRGVTVEIATPANISHSLVYITTEDTKTNHLLVELKTCENAHIKLHASSEDLETDFIEIVLGSSRKDMNYMQRKGAPRSITKLRKKLLSCHEYVPLWVSWTEDSVRIGTGVRVGADVVLDGPFDNGNNPRMPVKAISFQTDVGSPGNWKLPALM